MFLKNDEDITLDMKKVYLKRTQFKIEGKEVKEDRTKLAQPESLYDVLKDLVTG